MVEGTEASKTRISRQPSRKSARKILETGETQVGDMERGKKIVKPCSWTTQTRSVSSTMMGGVPNFKAVANEPRTVQFAIFLFDNMK